ncbi:hypothetical protein KAR91_73990 [Candidatus Pacearchaeota archaeon]|nr:hypothetical protein [Candidatus Pacearchaeota archaeon]
MENSSDGWIECPECEGRRLKKQGFFTLDCPQCSGKGKVDWVTNIMRTKTEPPDNVIITSTPGISQLVDKNPYSEALLNDSYSACNLGVNDDIMDVIKPLIEAEVKKQVKEELKNSE